MRRICRRIQVLLKSKSRCPFCGLCLQKRGFGAHFRSHVRDGAASAVFTPAFRCLCCRREEQDDCEKEGVMIILCSAWDAHVLAAHGEVARIWTVGSSTSTVLQSERGRLRLGRYHDGVQRMLANRRGRDNHPGIYGRPSSPDSSLLPGSQHPSH
jgi:hypothetical protein